MDYSLVKFFKKVLAIGIGGTLSLVVFAFLLEVTDSNGYNTTHVDPLSGLTLYNPNSSVTLLTGCFENVAIINNLGFHGPPVVTEKGEDVFRIVVIGSSFVEARQVQTEEMFSTVLEKKLNADTFRTHTYEVVPLGFNGNGTFLSTLYYKYYGSMLKPDLVIAVETGYELYRHPDSPPLDSRGEVILEAPKIQDSAMRKLLRNSKLLVNLYSRFLLFKDASLAFISRPFFFMSAPAPVLGIDARQAEEKRWATKEKIVDALAREVQSDGAQLLFAAYAGREEPNSTIEEISRHMEPLASTKGFYYHNLVPFVFTQEIERGEKAAFLPCDGHWSPSGHRFVAQSLYEYLSRNPHLLQKK